MTYEYSLMQNSSCIQRIDSETGYISIIPPDQANSDYQAYLAWVASGNVATYPLATPAIAWSAYQMTAQNALDATDVTMHRISEAVALGLNSWTGSDVVAWVSYRRSLRAIISAPTGTPGTLPAKPAYPAGT